MLGLHPCRPSWLHVWRTVRADTSTPDCFRSGPQAAPTFADFSLSVLYWRRVLKLSNFLMTLQTVETGISRTLARCLVVCEIAMSFYISITDDLRQQDFLHHEIETGNNNPLLRILFVSEEILNYLLPIILTYCTPPTINTCS